MSSTNTPGANASKTSSLFQPALPPALRESALQRLGFVMRMIAGALVISEGLHWMQVAVGYETGWQVNSLARLVTLGPTLLCWMVLERDTYRPAFRLGFARVWLWCVTLALAYMEWMSLPGGHDYGLVGLGVSRVCLVVTLAPVLIPDSLWSNFTYSGALFCTVPLGFALARLTGQLPIPTADVLAYLSANLVAVGAAWMSSATVNQLREQLAGQFGSYKLVRKLSTGGFGEVWEAAHRHLRRPAAIKIMKTDIRDEIFVERFLREAATLSSLECAHTVRLFDYGAGEDGTLYLAMELLQGLNLEDLVHAHGPQAEGRVVSLLSQACLSLEEAHEKELIHRDIKPANLFVSRVGIESDFLKVLDFGLVKTVTDGQAHLTKADEVVGTPDCMAPEQIAGQALDGRSDLYSLGCVGYFLLTGTPVFAGETAVQMIMQHMSKNPEAPSKRLGREVDPRLEEIILGCLKKDPKARPESARALYDQLLLLPQWTRQESQAWWEEAGGSSVPPGQPRSLSASLSRSGKSG